MFEQTMCSSNLQAAQVREIGRYLQARDMSPFLNRGLIFASVHSLGTSPDSIDCWKRWANTGSDSVANSFRTQGCSSSGPKA